MNIPNTFKFIKLDN